MNARMYDVDRCRAQAEKYAHILGKRVRVDDDRNARKHTSRQPTLPRATTRKIKIKAVEYDDVWLPRNKTHEERRGADRKNVTYEEFVVRIPSAPQFAKCQNITRPQWKVKHFDVR